MSRRAPGPDRQEQNRSTLKSLVKLDANKSCADCKRNKHPRWASWNIGVFVCIRCSGIHRSMGVHISRVKSVDLDSWTDEQMASMLRWGNARANAYWEHKLAEGHVPNEAKIENFIRTKYDSRRWVMDGPMPDPSTLDDGGTADDDVPLNVVREKATMQRASSVRNGAAGGLPQPPRQRAPPVDLFGDFNESEPARPSTTEPAVSRAPPPPAKAPAAPPKQTRQGESLLGLDFFGGTQSAPPRPSSTTGLSTPGPVPGRADLKNSILSLYASASKPAAAPQRPQQAPQQQPQSNMDLFGGMASPPLSPPTQQPSSTNAMGSMSDAFGSLSFSQPAAKPTPFSNLASPATSSHTKAKSSLSGGSFFDPKPAVPPKPSAPAPQPRKASGGFADFGDFSSAPSPVPSARSPPPSASSGAGGNGMGDLFSLSSPPLQASQAPNPTPTSPPKPAPAPRATKNPAFPTAAAFNLSQPAAPKPAPQPSFAATGSANPWSSAEPEANAWTTPDPAPAPTPSAPLHTQKVQPAPPVMSGFDAGWGDEPTPAPAKPVVQQQDDDDFGGWSHASPVVEKPSTGGGGGGGGSGGQDDLFGNVWG